MLKTVCPRVNVAARVLLGTPAGAAKEPDAGAADAAALERGGEAVALLSRMNPGHEFALAGIGSCVVNGLISACGSGSFLRRDRRDFEIAEISFLRAEAAADAFFAAARRSRRGHPAIRRGPRRRRKKIFSAISKSLSSLR